MHIIRKGRKIIKRVKKFTGFLVLGIICTIACILFFRYESSQQKSRYRLTVGTAMLAIVFFWGAFTSFSKKYDRNAIMVIEDIFQMQSGGCVVVGMVQGGFMVHDKVEVTSTYHDNIKSKIDSMEIQGKKTKIAKNCKVAIYLKNIEPSQIHIQDKVIYHE